MACAYWTLFNQAQVNKNNYDTIGTGLSARGKTCKKIPSYMHDSIYARDLLFKKLKYSEVIVNIFKFCQVWQIV